MRYLKIQWSPSRQQALDLPILLYVEIDSHRREQRKICYFRDGPPGYASRTTGERGVMLDLQPLPTLEALSADATIVAADETSEEFEKQWQHATHSPRESRGLWEAFLAFLATL